MIDQEDCVMDELSLVATRHCSNEEGLYNSRSFFNWRCGVIGAPKYTRRNHRRGESVILNS